ncbi:hypothetical protein CTZ27_03810 [Streptomyces griseocarneus]|nr:hypothetical protein CTZ27_03810 [Streptomyces griseocarneus]
MCATCEQPSITGDMLRMYDQIARRDGDSPEGPCAAPGLPSADAAARDRLLALGLLRHDDHHGTYRVQAPHVAEAATLALLRSRLRTVQESIDNATTGFGALRDLYHASTDRGQVGDGSLLLLEGPDVNTMLQEAAAECSSDLMTAQPGGPRPAPVLDEARDRDTGMLARGVRMRTLYQHSARFSPHTETYSRDLIDAGAEIRTLNVLFPRLLIFDRRTAFIPAGTGSSALLVRQPDIVAFLTATFETAWRCATPFASAYETRRDKLIVSDIQRSIARLLLREDKDAAIARCLGISERTCRNHIAKMMAQLGARNRTHLGYLLATKMHATDDSTAG